MQTANKCQSLPWGIHDLTRPQLILPRHPHCRNRPNHTQYSIAKASTYATASDAGESERYGKWFNQIMTMARRCHNQDIKSLHGNWQSVGTRNHFSISVIPAPASMGMTTII
jgi:hypothetical protein